MLSHEDLYKKNNNNPLHEALKILDKNCFHFPQHLMNFVNYDAAVDSSTAFCFKFLDVYFYCFVKNLLP